VTTVGASGATAQAAHVLAGACMAPVMGTGATEQDDHAVAGAILAPVIGSGATSQADHVAAGAILAPVMGDGDTDQAHAAAGATFQKQAGSGGTFGGPDQLKITRRRRSSCMGLGIGTRRSRTSRVPDLEAYWHHTAGSIVWEWPLAGDTDQVHSLAGSMWQEWSLAGGTEQPAHAVAGAAMAPVLGSGGTDHPVHATAGSVDALSAAETRFKDLWVAGTIMDPGDPAATTITFTRASQAKNPWTGATLAINEPARRQVAVGDTGISLYEYAIFGPYTRINDADLRNWTATGTAVVALGAQADDDYRLTLADGDTVYENETITAAIKYFFGFLVRKISGDATGLTARMVDASDGGVWANIDLSGITESWAWAGLATPTAPDDTDAKLIIQAAAGVVIEVQYVQLTAGDASNAHRYPFMPGAGKAVAHAADVCSNNKTVGDVGSLATVFACYSHQVQAGMTTYPPLFYKGSAFHVSREGAIWNPALGGARPTTACDQAADTRASIAVVWDRTTDNEAKIYEDGNLDDTKGMTGSISYAGWEFGERNGTSRYINGFVAYIYAPTGELSADDLAAIGEIQGHGDTEEWLA
jgi:hypothetical protein